MGDINKVIIVGNVGGEPELKYTANGAAVCTFSVATSRRYQRNDEWQEETEWVSVVTWNQLAERTSAAVGKGTRVYVEGRLATRSWQTDDGSKRYKTEVIAAVVSPQARRKDSSNEGGEYGGNNADFTVPDDLPF